MEDQLQRKSLGDFLKTRRASLSPQAFGFRDGFSRRRTPGLRREEVAQLAGVSLTWYTWLEQGREMSASHEVLESIGNALQLTPAERQYLHRLNGRQAPQATPEASPLTEAFLEMVRTMPHPFFVIDPRNRLVAWNTLACELVMDFAAVPEEERVMLKLIFLHPMFRERVVNWEQSTKLALAYYRKHYDLIVDQGWYTDLVSELQARSELFADWWARHEVGEKNGMRVDIAHPDLGLLRFEVVTFSQINDLEAYICCMYVPLPGSGTAEKLAGMNLAGLKL